MATASPAAGATLEREEPLARPPPCLLGSSRPDLLTPSGASRPMLWCAPLPVCRNSACPDEPAPAGETHPPERATLTSLSSISASRISKLFTALQRAFPPARAASPREAWSLPQKTAASGRRHRRVALATCRSYIHEANSRLLLLP